LSQTEVEAAYSRFTELADRKKRIYDQDLLSLIPVAARAHAELVEA
jgi:2-isopropylmalate synthase